MRYSIKPGDRIYKILQSYTKFYAPAVTLSEVVWKVVSELFDWSKEVNRFHMLSFENDTGRRRHIVYYLPKVLVSRGVNSPIKIVPPSLMWLTALLYMVT